jgi:hypothetical protein
MDLRAVTIAAVFGHAAVLKAGTDTAQLVLCVHQFATVY